MDFWCLVIDCWTSSHTPAFLQIFRTPEGMLSSEQGVYVAESIASKNTKQAKGRFRVYDDHEVVVNFACLILFVFKWCVVQKLILKKRICFFVSFQDEVSSNHSVKREHAGVGKKESGKLAKKAGKFSLQSLYAQPVFFYCLVCSNVFFWWTRQGKDCKRRGTWDAA